MTLLGLNWRLTLFSIVFLAFFLALGTWQVQRGQAKTAMLLAAEVRKNQPGDEVSASMAVQNGDPLRTTGQFRPESIFLLDNRVLEGRVGYEVIQLFETDSGVGLLVNRGFVAGGRTRADLPQVPPANQATQAIRGHAYLTELAVPDENIVGETSPWVIQVAKPEVLRPLVGQSLFSHIVRLEEAHPDALPRYWPVTTMSPERHYGYAVTWYLMALAVVAVFLVALKTAKREESYE